MKKNKIILTFCLLVSSISSYNQVANFLVPDTVCVNQSIDIQNTTIGASTNYWNFCSGNLASTPIGINLGNIGSLSGPVYSAIAKDGNNYYVFITNYTNGTLTRLSFGSSLINIPVATNLGTLGILGGYLEGIQIIKDNISGNWYGLILNGQNNYLVRLSFGTSLSNTPTAVNLGNINNLMNYPHAIYTFNEGGNWYSYITNFYGNNLLRLNFGNSLANIPNAVSIGNIGGLNGPVGLYPIQENNIWYLFVTNQYSNSLSRLNFGNSLLNNPTGINLGNINGTMNDPRAITIIRDCGQVFGFVVNEISNDMVRLTFPGGLTTTPSGITLGNLANFSFPHHISELFRVGDSLYTFIVNEINHTVSRICFPSCNNSSIVSSNLQNPPTFSYNVVGTYSINLTVNEGLPNQSNICKEIVVVNAITAVINGISNICMGDTLKLIGSSVVGCTFHWTGPNGFTSTDQNIILPNANSSNSGTYSLIVTKNNCSSNPVTKNINVIAYPIINLGNDTSICQGNNVILNAGNSGCNYQWSSGQITQTVNVSTLGVYSVIVTNASGCVGYDTININISSVLHVNLGKDTTICSGETLQLSAGNPCAIYLWNTNAITQTINVTNPGDYWVTVNNTNCTGSDTINVNIVAKPIISLGNDTIMCPGDLLVLSPGSGFNYYLWSNGFNTSSINVSNPGNYYVTVGNGACFVSDEIYIEECGSEIWVPNVFTPNGDGINETFYPVYFNIDKITLLIFNRWGNQLYEGSGIAAVWDGKYYGEFCPPGVYYYVIDYEKKGKIKGPQKKHGSVSLLK